MNAEIFVMPGLWLALLSILLIPALPARHRSMPALAVITAHAVLTSVPAIYALTDHDVQFTLNGGFNFGTIPVAIDPLSAWFILIINLTVINGTLYGSGYMKAYGDRQRELSLHWVLMVIFHAAMVWVCMLRNSLAFLIAWEIMTLASFLLVVFEHDSRTVKAGVNYLIQMHIGVALLSVAFIVVSIRQGSFDFSSIADFFSQAPARGIILLFFAGFAFKAGMVPFHTWLPHAHPAAPSHVSGIMSGVIVKTGIYGILRIMWMVRHDLVPIGMTVVAVSAVTTLYGILNASVHRDLKKLLAFCTTENIGIVGMGIGLALIGKGSENPVIALLGLSAALLHTLNHSLYKSLLFFTAGNIYRQTHTRNMEQLGGLIRTMPQTALLFLGGVLGIAGMPPFNGFVSKFLVYSGFLESFHTQSVMMSALLIICAAILAMAGGVSVVAFSKSFGMVFLGTPRQEKHIPPGDVPARMRIPLFATVALMLAIGLFPGLLITFMQRILTGFMPGSGLQVPAGITGLLGPVGRASALLIGIAAVLWLIRLRVSQRKPVSRSSTWGCGYTAPTPALQYTAKSYSKSLARLFGFYTLEGKKFRELKTASIFPSPRSYHSYYLEFFENRIIDPVTKLFLRIFTLFGFIHNGRIQYYVLYGFFFVIALMLLSLLNLLN